MYKGVNLGGWLIQESWMTPVPGKDREWANLDTIKALEKKFTKEQVQELFDTYQDNWITEFDFKTISEAGCNLVRIPFWYRNFMEDEYGTWITEDHNNNPGFKRLDWAIEMAEKYNLSVVLDLHGAPGGQSMDHSSGTLMENRLYTDERCQQAMEDLWIAIAERYKDKDAVVLYDIMNEPQNNSGYEGENSYDPWEPKSWELSNKIYDRMYHAIRKIDKDTKISMEAIWQISNLPDPKTLGWENVVYQMHLYDDDQRFLENAISLKNACEKYNVDPYIGEFSNLNGIKIANDLGISWTTWTYKGTNKNLDNFFWYFSYEPESIDLEKDSFEEMKEKWGEILQTEKSFNLQNGTFNIISKGLKD